MHPHGSGSQPLLQARRDSGRAHGEPDLRDVLMQQVHVLSLDQIRAIRNTNEYTEGPTVAPRPGVKSSPRVTAQPKNERPHGLPEHRHFSRIQHTQTHASPRAPLSRSISTVSTGSRSSTRTSTSSNSSEQRLLGSSSGPVADGIVRMQPKSELKASELKPLSKEDLGAHSYRHLSQRDTAAGISRRNPNKKTDVNTNLTDGSAKFLKPDYLDKHKPKVLWLCPDLVRQSQILSKSNCFDDIIAFTIYSGTIVGLNNDSSKTILSAFLTDIHMLHNLVTPEYLVALFNQPVWRGLKQ
ncbi:hypothetical protein IHE44_0005299 [Lamprotornis superbus]|uniref:Uncharacterized protein n=1 Tax=Lamprotornis superbus TaxID=245042 RepID=A0A835NK56_9PASS|nr:hypothetical protein IHE44_0005299 [Lamprotornis superbus]